MISLVFIGREIGRGCKVFRCDTPTYGITDDEDREIYTTFGKKNIGLFWHTIPNKPK